MSASDSPPPRTSSDSGRRRSSGMFANLTQQKRGSEASQQRRESLSEMSQKPGVLGSMFNNVFKGGATTTSDQTK